MTEVNKPSDSDKQRVDEMCEKLKAVLEEYNFALAHMGIILKPKNPDWDINANRSWLVENRMILDQDIFTKSNKFEDTESDSEHEDVVMLNDLYRTISILEAKTAQFYMATEEQRKSSVGKIEEHLGLHLTKIVPLQADTDYLMYTKGGTVYSLRYDSMERYFVNLVEGDDTPPPSDALSLIGCLNPGGEIYRGYTPSISTNDRVMLQHYPFDPDEGISTNIYVTPEVVDVIKEEDIN